MSQTKACSFVIESSRFAKLERALSVALPAAQSLGNDAGIFWLRDSIFAATPYASIGLANCGLEIEGVSGCIAISQFAARSLLFELRTWRVYYLERIFVAASYKLVFSFEYDRRSKISTPPLVSCYSGSWRPRMTPREHYERLLAHPISFECELSIREMTAKLRSNEEYGYVVLEGLSGVASHVAASRLLLLAFLEAAKNEDTTFLLAYYGDQRCIVCRAGDVIAIISVID